MSPGLEVKLRRNGWFPGRRIDDALLNRWLRAAVEERGCRLFPEAVRILREFGDLSFDDIYFGVDDSPSNDISLSLQQVHEDHQIWLSIEWELNEVLFPIAYELGQGFTFAVSSTGKFFHLGISTVYCGDSIEAFLGGQRQEVSIEPTLQREAVWSEVEQLYKAIYEVSP